MHSLHNRTLLACIQMPSNEGHPGSVMSPVLARSGDTTQQCLCVTGTPVDGPFTLDRPLRLECPHGD